MLYRTQSAKMLSNKKGVTDSLRVIAGLVIFFFILIFILIPLGTNIYRLFVPAQEQGTEESLNRLTHGLMTLMGSDEDKCQIPFFVDEDYAIVGFSYEQESVTETNWWNEEVTKPPACSKYACICMCKGGAVGDVDGGDCAETNRCFTHIEDDAFKNINDFQSDGTSTEGKGFVLYGENAAGGDYKASKLIIEKQGTRDFKVYRYYGADPFPNCINLGETNE